MKPNVVFRPPETDSEDDYDGFYFGDDISDSKKIRSVCWTSAINGPLDELYNALQEGDLATFKELHKRQAFNVDEYIKGGLTPLLLACQLGHVDIVEYLLEELHASPNKHSNSVTPLMSACGCKENLKKKDNWVVEKLVKILLRNGAAIDIADKYGVTPFMLACKNGYTSAVRLMINENCFNNVDNMGCTPIFYAIENNHPEIVKILVEKGVNTSTPNAKGYTPRQVAQMHGFYDLLEFIPKEKEAYVVPSSFLSYCTLNDVIPRLVLKSECPEYFQEIYQILLALELDHLLEYFAKNRVPLRDFLCMDNLRLKNIGIELPINQMKIQKGLLDFHLLHWKKRSVARVHKSAKDNFYEILLITGNHLKDLIILKSSLLYIKNNIKQNKLGNISSEQLKTMENNLEGVRKSVNEFRKTVKYLSSFSPPQNPLYIDFDEIQKERKQRKMRRFFKFTTFIVGVTVFIYFKKRIF